MVRSLLLLTFATLLVTLSRSSMAQSSQGPVNPDGTHLSPLAQQSQGMGAPPVKSGDEATEQLLQSYRKQRQQELLRDADKLHQLSGELKDFLDKNNSNVLSLDMLKKAEAVEKLAHSVITKVKELQ